jgi:transposase
MLKMLDRHAVKEFLKGGKSTREVAAHFGVSLRTIQRIRREPEVESADDRAERRRRGIGRPPVAARTRDRLAELIAEDPEAPALEVLRLLREEGVRLGESTFYRLYAEVKEMLPVELLVRFEGVAGEFAQFDFGQADVRLLSGEKKRIHFAAYRLKYSRWVHVVRVPNERAEPLIRALLESFERSGGVPLSVVFDRPKTVVVDESDGRPIWHPALGQAAIDYGFVIELCAPRSPEQKGSVENLVGFVKRSFFRARRFADAQADVDRQLEEWLADANEHRPSRATREVPVVRLRAERARMRTLALPAAEYALRLPVHVGATALVEHEGVRYAMPAESCGLPATLHLYRERVKITAGGGRFEVTHPRFPRWGHTCYLSGQRSEQLARVAGERKRLYFMRERLLELGPVGEAYLTELIHQRRFTWKGDVLRLFTLLEQVGEERFLRALQRALFLRLYGAEYVEQSVKVQRDGTHAANPTEADAAARPGAEEVAP